MLRTMLKSKIHRASITEADLDYVGSISIDPDLMARADLVEFEKVLVANLANGARFETYAIAGRPGRICLNGAAARLGAAGDRIIVMAFAQVDDAERAAGFAPRVGHVDEKNRVLPDDA